MPASGLAYAVARWVSILGHPFVLVLVLLAVAAPPRAGVAALLPLALVLALVIVPLGYFLRRQVRVGRWQTVDASEPGDRTALYLVAIPLLLALLLAATAFPVLVGLARGVAAVLAILVLAFLLNRWVKTSLHMAFAGYVAVACLASVRVVGVVLLVFLPLLAWARLAMGRHRPVEVVMGAALGLAVGIGALALG